MRRKAAGLVTLAAALTFGMSPAHAYEETDAGFNNWVTGGSAGIYQDSVIEHNAAIYSTYDEGVVGSEAPAHRIDHGCTFQGTAPASTLVYQVVGVAHATAHTGVAATGIRCVLMDRFGAIVWQGQIALSGDTAVLVNSLVALYIGGPYTICSQGDALWNDLDVRVTGLRCRVPTII